MKFKINSKKQLVKAKLTKKDIAVILPSGIKEISSKAFFGDNNLELIEFCKDLLRVGDGAFFACDNLKNVYFNERLEYIGENAFQQCESLKKMELPKNLKHIGEAAFAECSSLEYVKIPDGVVDIEKYAFYKCENLKKVELPSSVLNLGENVFNGCENLEELILGNINFLFKEHYGLDSVISKFPFCYFDRVSGKLLLSKAEKKDLEGFEKVDYKDNTSLFNCDKNIAIILSIVFNKEKLKDLEGLSPIISNVIRENIDNSNYLQIRERFEYLKEFKGLVKRLNEFYDINEFSKEYYNIFKFAFSLGAFDENKSTRQRACEFIYEMCENKILDFSNVNNIFELLDLKIKLNTEWVSFITDKNNFRQLIEIENKHPNFISKIYNKFDEIREFSRSNRGSQRYRRVTVEMCEKYMFEMHFDGVDDSNQDIADVLKLYAHKQGTFDKACEIRKKYLDLKKNKKIKDHILGEELFSSLKDIEKEILDGFSDTMKNLNELANERFTYEYLSKNDVVNFVLGIYCNCCAHLEGVGKGIVEATILHPDCQCLVIRNNKGEIIGKSSLYVNRKRGYAIFNNVELNENNLSEDDKNLIYIKYMEAVDTFAKKYNKKYPFNPIRQINVGMTSNKLAYQMRGLESAERILSAEGFSRFSLYDGDWRYNQKIIWEIDSDLRR